MKTFSRGKHLYKFLRKNQIFDLYMSNLFIQHGNSMAVCDYCVDKDIARLLDHFETIDDSFTWADTPEGQDFWADFDHREQNQWDDLEYDVKIVMQIK